MLKTRPGYPLLDIHTVDKNEGSFLIECAGEVDIETAPKFRAALDDALQTGNHHRLILDLRAVTFIDSVGVGHIVSAYKRLRPDGQLQICTENQHIRMLLEIAGLNNVSSVHRTVAEALQKH